MYQAMQGANKFPALANGNLRRFSLNGNEVRLHEVIDQVNPNDIIVFFGKGEKGNAELFADSPEVQKNLKKVDHFKLVNVDGEEEIIDVKNVKVKENLRDILIGLMIYAYTLDKFQEMKEEAKRREKHTIDLIARPDVTSKIKVKQNSLKDLTDEVLGKKMKHYQSLMHAATEVLNDMRKIEKQRSAATQRHAEKDKEEEVDAAKLQARRHAENVSMEYRHGILDETQRGS